MPDPAPHSQPQPSAQVSLDLNAHVQSVCERHVVVLFKEVLGMFEQLGEEHYEALHKLFEALPEQYQPYVDLADHFTQEKADRIRRAVLARGNDCKRSIRDELAKYTMTLGALSPTIAAQPSTPNQPPAP